MTCICMSPFLRGGTCRLDLFQTWAELLPCTQILSCRHLAGFGDTRMDALTSHHTLHSTSPYHPFPLTAQELFAPGSDAEADLSPISPFSASPLARDSRAVHDSPPAHDSSPAHDSPPVHDSPPAHDSPSHADDSPPARSDRTRSETPTPSPVPSFSVVDRRFSTGSFGRGAASDAEGASSPENAGFVTRGHSSGSARAVSVDELQDIINTVS